MVIYEVNLAVDTEVAEAYADWLGPHIDEILALLEDPGDLPLADSAQTVRYSRALLLTSLDRAFLLEIAESLLEGLPDDIRQVLDQAGGAPLLVDIQSSPEVQEAHRLAGDIDYILKVRVANARAYDVFYQALISEVRVHNVTALLSMEEIKSTTMLPLAP